MNISEKREVLKGMYRSTKWATKVRKMTDSQVIAIYLRLQQQQKV